LKHRRDPEKTAVTARNLPPCEALVLFWLCIARSFFAPFLGRVFASDKRLGNGRFLPAFLPVFSAVYSFNFPEKS
jgi:hypothetical protein